MLSLGISGFFRVTAPLFFCGVGVGASLVGNGEGAGEAAGDMIGTCAGQVSLRSDGVQGVLTAGGGWFSGPLLLNIRPLWGRYPLGLV